MNSRIKMLEHTLLQKVVLLSMVIGILGSSICAYAGEIGLEEKQTSVIFSKDIDIYSATAGDTITISVPVKSINDVQLNNPFITPECPEGLAVTSKVVLFRENEINTPTNINSYVDTYVTFDVKINETVSSGMYDVKLKVDYFESVTNNPKSVTIIEPIRVKVTALPPTPSPRPTAEPTPTPALSPSLTISRLQHTGGDQLKRGDSFKVTAVIKNKGNGSAKKVQAAISGYNETGILQNYQKEKRELGNIDSNGSVEVTFPVYVSGKAVGGVKTLTLTVTYQKSSGETYEEKSELYITIPEVPVSQQTKGKANLLVRDVKQSPKAPMAGGKLALSYIIENKGSADAYDIKIEPGLSNTTFSPNDSAAYQYIEYLAAGDSVKIKLDYTVSKSVVAGLNEIPLAITYKERSTSAVNSVDSAEDGSTDGGSGGTTVEELSTSAKLYVLNVQNPEKKESNNSVGVPKLIIVDFNTGEDNIKAGKEFGFTFDINNTHSSLSANNIKVTITSEENAFSIAEGSNSFYISKIKPGETSHQRIQLKAKADCVTKAYPLKIDFEYEYDGMPKLENQISTGLTISETLNLQVFENSRPTVSNIIVGTWDAPIAFTPCNMSFDFYNMGKSTLYNVTARVESSDYQVTQQTVFIGNVEAGNGNTHEFEVTPQVENMEATGKLIITYEDSNGNSYEVVNDLPPTLINVANTYDPSLDIGDQNFDIPVEKKEIISLWPFVGVQAGVFIIAIFITRKLIIVLYKGHLHKKEELED